MLRNDASEFDFFEQNNHPIAITSWMQLKWHDVDDDFHTMKFHFTVKNKKKSYNPIKYKTDWRLQHKIAFEKSFSVQLCAASFACSLSILFIWVFTIQTLSIFIFCVPATHTHTNIL